ncbi:MAG: glycosyltransferase [Flavobacteriia bacterium]|nr:glycosyltransferase [Flavobacteriia bacterium]
MLSILIPNFDENVDKLVRDLYAQASELDTSFEILICDQSDSKENFEINNALNELEEVQYFKWSELPGRAANRNHLASKAKGEWYFFIDSDAELIHPWTLSRFWKAKHSESAICGTMYYRDEDPGPEFRLRWKYGRKREMRSPIERSKSPFSSFISFAFLIGCDSFEKVKFNESVVEYGHEDTLFGKHLKYAMIRPMHIDADILHNGLIPADEFIEKVRQSIRSLALLTELGHIDDDFKIYKIQQWLAKARLDYVLALKFKVFRGLLEYNLKGKNPSLFLLDVYKLGYYCTLRKGLSKSAKTLRS